MMELKNLATFRRYLLSDSSLLIVKGDIGPVIEGFKAYNSRFGIENPDEEIWPTITALMAAVGLAAVSLAERESWAWTLTWPESSFGYFAGVEPEGMMCLRVKEADSKTTSVIVQRQKPMSPFVQSHFKAKSSDPAGVVEQYFEEVEQIRTRLILSPQGSGLLVHGLPGCDFDEWAGIEGGKLAELIGSLEMQGQLKRLDEVLLFYECRCSDGMVVGMIENLPKDKRDELWAGLEMIEVECPRCGRKFAISKKEAVG